MPNLFSPESQKMSYGSTVLISVAVDLWLMLNEGMSFEDKVEVRGLITIAWITVFLILGTLDRHTTTTALTNNPNLADKHPDLKGMKFHGDKQKITDFLQRTNLEVLSLDAPNGKDRFVIREREFLSLLLAIPWISLSVVPHQVRAIRKNIQNSKPKQ